MKPVAQMTLPELRKLLAKVDAELKTREPELFAEQKLLRTAIQGKEAGRATGGVFSKIRSPQEAIIACLQLHKTPMALQAVFDALLAGGFALDPEAGKNVFNVTARRITKSGLLEVVKEDGPWDTVVKLGSDPSSK